MIKLTINYIGNKKLNDLFFISSESLTRKALPLYAIVICHFHVNQHLFYFSVQVTISTICVFNFNYYNSKIE